MQRFSFAKIVLPIVVIAGALGVTVMMISNKKPPEQEERQDKTLLIEVVKAEPTRLRFKVDAQGSVKPKHHMDIIAEVQGKIVEVSPRFVNGGFFKKGELLIRIDPADYQGGVHSAEAELLRAQANLQEEQARAKVAELDWKQFAPDKTPELGLRKPQLAREAANVRSAQTTYETAKRNLLRTEIRAPYDGMVYRKAVDIGQFVSFGTQLGTIYGTESAEIRLPLNDDDLAFLELPFIYDSENAQMPKVSLSAKVAGQPVVWDAQLRGSEGIIDDSSRVVYLVAEVDDPYGRNRDEQGYVALKYGRFVQASISGQEFDNVFVLPRHLLRRNDEVLMVDKDNKLMLRSVEVARVGANNAYITGGLEAGQRLALTPISNPLNGMQVRIKGEPISEDDAKKSVAIATVEE